LCIVVDPPSAHANTEPGASVQKKKRQRKEKGGIEEWFVNVQHEGPGIDDVLEARD
jgi:hypothetical protein